MGEPASEGSSEGIDEIIRPRFPPSLQTPPGEVWGERLGRSLQKEQGQRAEVICGNNARRFRGLIGGGKDSQAWVITPTPSPAGTRCVQQKTLVCLPLRAGCGEAGTWQGTSPQKCIIQARAVLERGGGGSVWRIHNSLHGFWYLPWHHAYLTPEGEPRNTS